MVIRVNRHRVGDRSYRLLVTSRGLGNYFLETKSNRWTTYYSDDLSRCQCKSTVRYSSTGFWIYQSIWAIASDEIYLTERTSS
jgi:hypothetical protein